MSEEIELDALPLASETKTIVDRSETSTECPKQVPATSNPTTPQTERPKVSKKFDNDEEFDTDSEEEDEKPVISNDNKTETSDYSKHLTYDGDLCIYTEPGTNKQLIWDAKKNSWMPRGSEAAGADDPMKNYEFDGKNYVYTDKNTNVTYKFDQEKNEWIEKAKDEEDCKEQTGNIASPSVAASGGVYGFENDTHTYTDPNDGTVYIWDKDKSAWFPKVSEITVQKIQYLGYIIFILND